MNSFYVLCDYCDFTPASLFCEIDNCFLCSSCDSAVHSNKITQRHVRVSYLSCPMWAYDEAKRKGRVVEGSNGISHENPATDVNPSTLLDNECLALAACWGSSPGSEPIIIDAQFLSQPMLQPQHHPPSVTAGSPSSGAHSAVNAPSPASSNVAHQPSPPAPQSHHSMASSVHYNNTPYHATPPPDLNAFNMQLDLNDMSDLVPNLKQDGNYNCKSMSEREQNQNLQSLLDELCMPPSSAEDLGHIGHPHSHPHPQQDFMHSDFFAENNSHQGSSTQVNPHNPNSLEGSQHGMNTLANMNHISAAGTPFGRLALSSHSSLTPLSDELPAPKYPHSPSEDAVLLQQVHRSFQGQQPSRNAGLLSASLASGGSQKGPDTTIYQVSPPSNCHNLQQQQEEQQRGFLPQQQQQQQQHVSWDIHRTPNRHEHGTSRLALSCSTGGVQHMGASMQQLHDPMHCMQTGHASRMAPYPIPSSNELNGLLQDPLPFTCSAPPFSNHMANECNTPLEGSLHGVGLLEGSLHGGRRLEGSMHSGRKFDGSLHGRDSRSSLLEAPNSDLSSAHRTDYNHARFTMSGNGEFLPDALGSESLPGSFSHSGMRYKRQQSTPLTVDETHPLGSSVHSESSMRRQGSSLLELPRKQMLLNQSSLHRQGSLQIMPALLEHQQQSLPALSRHGSQQIMPALLEHQQQSLPALSRHGSQLMMQALLEHQHQQKPQKRASLSGSFSGAINEAALNGSMRGASLYHSSLISQQKSPHLPSSQQQAFSSPSFHQQMQQQTLNSPSLQQQLQQQQDHQKPRPCLDLSSGPRYDALSSSSKKHAVVLNLANVPVPGQTTQAAGSTGRRLSSSSSLPCNDLSRMDSLNGEAMSNGGVGGSVKGGRGNTGYVSLVSRVQRPDGTFKEVNPERAVQLHRYRMKRMQRLKTYAEGQKKIRYECRKVLADQRPRFRGRFTKEGFLVSHSSMSELASASTGAVTETGTEEGGSVHGGGRGGGSVHGGGGTSGSVHGAKLVGGSAASHPHHLVQSEQIKKALGSFNLEALAQAILQQQQQSSAAAPPLSTASLASAAAAAEVVTVGGPSVDGKGADLITDEELLELGVSLAGQSAASKGGGAPLRHAPVSMDEEEEQSCQSQATSDSSSCPVPQLCNKNGSLVSGFTQVVTEPAAGHEVLSAIGLLDAILLDNFEPGGAVR
ncbi:hypothetical protein CEUSTIGMA_g7148.t1 [Chlamydomonas eustigma]|uniref:CCT domain-containing protein n=1 Tax=Chlamydomonas eustigma TaxID=1157962 RepID=A0A250X9H0_9CHLO|nr:hypothetical protein CEUSTIGMA_g7148.t1 [Chlamydomonas eustigma]|eukprot:GAX79707.1 hypothetical protein CEUSTIGMA_g7148.t1 [Chlamydomonas eustigma]